ncbi:MAG: PEP-CTERM sorting domain-containing protein [Pirellula sp.]|nr:PEP-CTERM sorting domain-containing protein [Pirellula sp.]
MEWTPKQFSFFSRKRDNVMLLRLSNLICGLMITMGLVLQPSSASGGFVTILPGYDLLVTESACYNFGAPFGLVPFVGVPIGTYDFGSGSAIIGATDTIVRRLDSVTLADGECKTINIAMTALSLRSRDQIDWSSFGGIANEYVKTVGVVDQGSTMTICNDFVGLCATFDSTIKISFQLQGVTSGAVASFGTKTFSMVGAGSWHQIPGTPSLPNLPVLINGVNNNLNGLDHSNDFFTDLSQHILPDGGKHSTVDVNGVVCPEPTSMFSIGLACMAVGGGFARRRRLQQAT